MVVRTEIKWTKSMDVVQVDSKTCRRFTFDSHIMDEERHCKRTYTE